MICLTGVGVAIYFNKYSTVFPPISSTCPDNYTSSSSSTTHDSTCTIDTNHINPSMPNSCRFINISLPQYNGQNGLCNKYTWATKCGVNWQGVTEESNDPCPIS